MSLDSGGVLKKKIWDFCSLIVVPEALENSLRIALILMAFLRLGEAITIVSSMDCVWDRGGWMPCGESPFRLQF